MTTLTEQGVSTTTGKDQFACEQFTYHLGVRVQWDYRDLAGVLHSGVAKSNDEARAKAAVFGYRG